MQRHERTQQLVTCRLEGLKSDVESLWSHCTHCPRDQCANTLECEINAISQHIDVSHKQACSDLQKATQFITEALQREVQRNMALRMLVHRLEERASENGRNLSEQVESNQQLKLQVDELQKHLQDKDNSVTQANQTISSLKNELKDLHQQLHSHQSNHRMIQEVTEWLQDGESQPMKVEADLLQNLAIGIKEEQDDAADAAHDDEDGCQCSQSDGADPPTEQTTSSSADIKSELVQEPDEKSDVALVHSSEIKQCPPDPESLNNEDGEKPKTARYPRRCKTLLEFTRGIEKSWTVKQRVEENGEGEQMQEEAVEEGAGGGVEEAADLDEGRHTPRAPYNRDRKSRLDGALQKHILERLPGKRRRRCRVCVRRGQRSETRLWCKACTVPLHAGQCYTDYHTRKTYM
ncbi:hypothetical protein ACEWY4_018675 [Coilia grayii]|uniref:Uncharacterized protein n=1 Tax=Coilia grayii TaxID=363190 RepID=A0ABD1JDW6_9TELE